MEAFAFFGGVPARLVPDNVKTGVDKPDLYDPKINRSYAELAALLVFQHVPVARTQALISDLTGARPSTGWISSVLSTVAGALADVEKLIKSLIVLHQHQRGPLVAARCS